MKLAAFAATLLLPAVAFAQGANTPRVQVQWAQNAVTAMSLAPGAAGGNSDSAKFILPGNPVTTTRVSIPTSFAGQSAAYGSWFSGDVSQLQYPIQASISGLGTFGTPDPNARVYNLAQEYSVIALDAFMQPSAGYNSYAGTTVAGGTTIQSGGNGPARTNWSPIMVKLRHYGQGDMGAMFVEGFMNGGYPSTTVTATIAGNVMSVSAVTPSGTANGGTVHMGYGVTGAGIGGLPTVAQQLTSTAPGGALGGIGTYQISSNQTIGSPETITLTPQSWASNPALFAVGGQFNANADGQFFEPLGDIDINDKGFSVTGIGNVFNFTRGNASSAQKQFWAGYRLNSNGTIPIDAAMQLVGSVSIGTDMTQASDGLFHILNYTAAALSSSSGDPAPGINYRLGDIVSIAGGTVAPGGAPTQWQVTNDSGSLTTSSLTLINRGYYSVAPGGAGATVYPVIGGSGTGATLSVRFPNTANVYPIVTKAGACIALNAVQGNASATLQLGADGFICSSASGGTINIGSATSVSTSPNGANDFTQGFNHLTTGQNNFQSGQRTNDDSQNGGWVWSSGPVSTTGSAQRTLKTLVASTSGTAAVRLLTNGINDGADGPTQKNSLLLVSNSAHSIHIESITAFDVTNTANYAGWRLAQGVVTRPTAGNSTAYKGGLSTATAPDSDLTGGTITGMTCIMATDINASPSPQTLNLSCTPPTGNTDQWDFLAVVTDDKVL